MYHIFTFSGAIPWDSVPVLKTQEYPFTHGDYKPYAIGSICNCEKGLAVRVYNFCVNETKEAKDHNFISFCLASEQRGLCIELSESGMCINSHHVGMAMLMNLPLCPPVHWFEGNDNLGRYWGADFILTPEILKEAFDRQPVSGDSLCCNIVTRCDLENKFHYGRVFSTTNDFPSKYDIPSCPTVNIL